MYQIIELLDTVSRKITLATCVTADVSIAEHSLGIINTAHTKQMHSITWHYITSLVNESQVQYSGWYSADAVILSDILCTATAGWVSNQCLVVTWLLLQHTC